jgi:GntR family transcriptional regulator
LHIVVVLGKDKSVGDQVKRLEAEFRASSPVPSIQVEQVLRQRLRRECQPGDRFPSEFELCEEFRVSRTLIRPILARLAEDGLLERRARLGRIATPRSEPAPAPLLSDLIDRLHAYLPNTQVTCLDIVTTAAEASIRERLRLNGTEPITVIRRVVTLDANTISYVVSFISNGLGARLAKKSVERHPLAWLLTNRLGVTIRKAAQTIEPVVADIDTARYLEVPVGAPLLLVERDFLGHGDKPIFHTRQFFRGDRYKFSTSLQWKRSAPCLQKRKKARSK